MNFIPSCKQTLLLGGLALALSGVALAADAPPAAAPAAPATGTTQAPAAAPLPMASATMLANTCAGCHGTNGASVGPASPSLAGINQEYFLEVMKAFKSGDRHSTVMNRIAKGYSDDEIKVMAKYFSEKKYVAGVQKIDAKKAAKGKQVHSKSCEKCHEEGGRVSEDGGILAGQWMPYLTYTMDDFTSGRSKMPKKMAAKVEKLSKEDVDALIHYYGSQK